MTYYLPDGMLSVRLPPFAQIIGNIYACPMVNISAAVAKI